MKQKKKGLFIVFDGTDGSGKATQAGILVKRLKKEGYRVEKIDFPRYGKKSAGLVEEYLEGKFGTAEEVGPYRASVFYASDRYAASFQINKWLDGGRIVIANRYTTANMGHQGGKIRNRAERKKYFEWLHNLEYNIFKIPRPEINLILHVDAGIAQKLALKKRSYLKSGKTDIHEKDLSHLRNAEKIYLEISRMFKDISLIECMENKRLMSISEVSDLVWTNIKRRL